MHSVPHSRVLVHFIFSTKDDSALIDFKICARLHAHITAVCTDLDAHCYRVGGADDHVHVVTTLPPTFSEVAFVEHIKKKSTKWVRANASRYSHFAWNRGYAAVSVSPGDLETTIGSVKDQEALHKTLSFEDELKQFVTENKIEADADADHILE